MLLPAGTGLLGLLAIAIFNRRAIPVALIALFVTAAVAAKAPQYYAYITPLLYAAAALYTLRQEERVVERVAGLLLGLAVIVASDNGPIADALKAISTALIQPFFAAISNAFIAVGFAAALVPLLAWSILAPRLIRMAEEEPLLALGYVVLGQAVIAGAVAPLPDYLRLALAIALLNQFSRAVRGNLEAVAEVAPALFLLGAIIEAQYLVALGAIIAIIELAVGLLTRRHLAGAGMWAVAITYL